MTLTLACASVAGCGQPAALEEPPLPYQFWASESVQCNGVRIHYWRTGGDAKPVMIMSHGITDYGLNWAALAAAFADDFDVIMYDARGHGFSSKPAGPYDLATHVEDLTGLIRELNIRKPILVGHSMGGSIVGLAGATHPELAAAIVMEDPPMEEALEQFTDAMVKEWRQWLTTQASLSKAALIDQARTKFHPGWNEFTYDHWAESKKLVVPRVLDVMEGEGFHNPRDYFQHITAPTLVLKADAAPEFRKRHLEAAALLPNGRLLHIEGAGHVIRNDRPQQAEQAIRDFLVECGLLVATPPANSALPARDADSGSLAPEH
ncbi:MAG: alpha/beta hydrolase [Planctomycetales bacterium]|nr:alpha/beta hydrolase [Planctomycetales bacterium]